MVAGERIALGAQRRAVLEHRLGLAAGRPAETFGADRAAPRGRRPLVDAAPGEDHAIDALVASVEIVERGDPAVLNHRKTRARDGATTTSTEEADEQPSR